MPVLCGNKHCVQVSYNLNEAISSKETETNLGHTDRCMYYYRQTMVKLNAPPPDMVGASKHKGPMSCRFWFPMYLLLL